MLEHFYHQSIRKVVVSFGSLFNNIYITRQDDSGKELERIKVPISYGPQQKFMRRLARIGTDFDNTKVKIENYIPRLSFEMSSFTYDPSRKLNTMNRTSSYKNGSTMKTRYEKVPYNMDLSLGIMTKNTEDALQIIEQILPYFQPEYTISIKMNEIDQNVNIPIVFKSCSIGEGDDGSYGNYDTRKLTYATLSFSSKLYLYGPIQESGIILNTAGINLIDMNSGLTAANINVYPNTGVTAGNYVPAGPTAQTVITEYPL
jgi:hypothetical protein